MKGRVLQLKEESRQSGPVRTVLSEGKERVRIATTKRTLDYNKEEFKQKSCRDEKRTPQDLKEATYRAHTYLVEQWYCNWDTRGKKGRTIIFKRH
ncbi:hypothetical protein AOXY_G289 [Acipenser oxyrinchus oxyrinchus]|uniref:Uncharacterized protein n=1 Tax=Acipenser oxyrinchus oxyrinchus TaxID=40147 RepID=A0AAD8LTC8_ACIOX|nr:hypothetical protein AOXY_G289 [Acipenser oxyrinchus oxyrinchus]